MALFEAQVTSRHLDLVARWLRGRGQGYYTISSAGHEANATVAAALRPSIRPSSTTGPAGSTCAAAMQVPGPRSPPGRAARPGRGHRRADGRRPPQGLRPPRPGGHPADLDDRVPPAPGRRGGVQHRSGAPARCPVGLADDAIAVCSFGDASANHSTATGRHQHGVPHRSPAPAPALCCSCARTTASASACARRPAGSRPPTGTGPTCAGSRPTACDPVATHRGGGRRRPTGSGPSGRRPSCTCAPSGSWPTPARTWRPRTARPAEIRDDYARDPILGTARCSASPAWRPPPRSSTTTSASAPRCGTWPRSARPAPS